MRSVAKESFAELRMVQVVSPELQKCSARCYEKAQVLLHTTLYRSVKITFLTDVCGIITGGWITSELDSYSLRQSVRVLTPVDFRPICDEA